MALRRVKKKKLWVIKAIDRCARRTVAWVLGGRDTATFRRLYGKVGHLKDCGFFTDRREAFAEVLPPERHFAGKEHTVTTEQDNSNTRHHLGRLTRRTKVVSKSEHMVDITLRTWHAVTTTDVFSKLQDVVLSIF